MKISIIIPTLNEARSIGQTVRFLLRHGGAQVYEVIISDGGSKDATCQLAEEAGAKVIHSPGKGRALQMNFGVEKSAGDVLYFVHADTQPPETFASDIETAMREGWRTGSFQYRFDSNKFMLRINSFFTRFSWLFCQGGDKTYFIRKSDFLALGGYDPDHVVMEEYDFLRRAKKEGLNYLIVPRQAIVSARKYDQNSWLRVQIANFVVFNLWAWGLAQPQTLRSLYVRMLN